LTIDKTLQHIAETALDKAVRRAGAKGGMAMVMDPYSAEVLAMASSPTYDPNRFHKYGPEYWRNRAVADSFEPGSVLKVFLLAAALEEGVAGVSDSVYCENGRYEVYDRVFHDTSKHGWLTVGEVIKHSSNIGAAKVGEKLGRERLYRYLQRFGFGAKSGIDAPGESEGRLRNYKNWSGVTLETVSFGQGISVTAVQLATALSAVANGGFLMKPRLVKRIVDPAGRTVYEAAPAIVKRVISEETARKVTRVLTTVTEPDGTGAGAAMDGFSVAGKTGTAQKASARDGGYRDGAYLVSFLGFAPADKPRFVIYVAIDEPISDTASGGKYAAPAFKEIAEEGLSYVGVFSDRKTAVVTASADTLQSPVVKIEEAAALADVEAVLGKSVPDFTGKTMRAVLRSASASGMEVDLSGSGRAVWQKPGPGAAMPKGRPVEVRFQ
jgi:cell division protein FtsI (penicillin-binding protein 3)